MNRVILVGNAVADVESRTTANGTVVAKLRIAVSGRSKDKDDTLFQDVTLFGKQAEIAGQYVTKGKQVLVEGRLQLDSWETKEGEKRKTLTVIGERIELLGGGPKKEQNVPVAVASEDDPNF
jgi:single-strand DNA-binding protein